jgi:hypothetical protein
VGPGTGRRASNSGVSGGLTISSVRAVFPDPARPRNTHTDCKGWIVLFSSGTRRVRRIGSNEAADEEEEDEEEDKDEEEDDEKEEEDEEDDEDDAEEEDDSAIVRIGNPFSLENFASWDSFIFSLRRVFPLALFSCRKHTQQRGFFLWPAIGQIFCF